MEFDLNNTKTDNTVKYNYVSNTFYKNQFEKRLDNGGYIKTSYISKSNNPNILSDNLFNGNYITKKLYIIKKIHKIKDVLFDGELIVEHTSLTNNEKPLFSCFLLKTENIGKTDIDRLIQADSDVTLDLNSFIQSQEAIFYKTKNENVVVFTKPISVTSVFDNYKSPNIISDSFDEYDIINIIPSLGNIEGFTGAESEYVDVATYCQPIDEEDPTIGVSSNVIIPADGKVAINKATTSQLSTALNFFGFFILVLFVVIVVPTMYHYFIVLLVLDNKYNDPPFTPQALLNRVSGVDIILGFLLFMFSFSLINHGIINNKPITTVVGFYVFIFFIASFIVLQYKRMFNEEEFLKNFGNSNGKIANISNINPDVWGVLLDNVVQLFFKKEYNILTKKYEFKFQFNFMIVAVIFGFIYFIMSQYGLNKSSGTSIFMSIPLYMFFLSIYIAVYIKHARDVKNRGDDMAIA